ncbi:MAG: hypothetical protein AB9836_09685 [Aminipila sp.]
MSGLVSYDLFAAKVGSNTNGFTSEGGIYETFINATGSPSVKGTIVVASTATDVYNGVAIAPISSSMPIGVIYENGIADGSPVKVVVYGKAQVLLEDSSNAVNGYWCGVSTSQAGRMIQLATVPSATQHNTEIGHSLQKVTGGTNILALVQVHFN